LTIDTMGPPARELLLRRTASIEILDGVPPDYLAAAAKSTQGDELAAFDAAVRDRPGPGGRVDSLVRVARDDPRIFAADASPRAMLA
jgi:hypothetical protein